MEIEKEEGSVQKIKISELSIPNYFENKEIKDERKLNTEKFLDELCNNRDSNLIQQFRELHQQGVNPQNEEIFSLSEKIFKLLNYNQIHRDTSNNTMMFNNEEITFSFSQDFKSDIIQLSGYQHRIQKSQQIDIRIQIQKDILTNLTHLVNSDIPYLTIDYIQRLNQIQCQTNTIGKLYDNYFNWLFYNIDSLTIACYEAVSGIQQICWNASIISLGPYESTIISERVKEKIKSKINRNKQNYYQLLFNIEQEFKNEVI
ncbi:hypothetical protein ABPG72_004219 [Tetrahymena utriculariae]